MTDTPVFCDCCNTLVGIIRDGVLEMRQKHHGSRHVTRIPLASGYPVPVPSRQDVTA